MSRLLASRNCVVCGTENASGMRLPFSVDTAGAEARWTVLAAFQGFDQVLHGGAICALLDDAMWYAAYGRGGVTLTAEATIRYRARVLLGTEVVVRGQVTSQRGRLWACRAELAPAGGGEALATAEAKFLTVPAADLPSMVGGTGVHELPHPSGSQPGLQ